MSQQQLSSEGALRTACPPAAKRGRTAGAPSPHVVIRGETSTSIDSPASLAHVDWLAFTLSLTVLMPDDESQLIRWLIGQLFKVFGLPEVTIQPTNSGWNGYDYRLNIGEGTQYGLIAFGGTNQRGTFHVELNATACAHVVDWNTVRQWGESLGAKITRVDLAHDDFEGEIVNIEIAKGWYEEGGFTTSGRPPKPRLIDDLGCGDGKTFYVGNRANGKMLRVYEKGRQLGDPSCPWVRVELELRNKNREIPWSVLTSPATFLAGSYPCLAYLSAEQDKVRTIKKTVEITLESMQRYLHTAGGKSINALMQANGEDAVALVGAIRREGIPRRLVNYADFLPHPIDGSEVMT